MSSEAQASSGQADQSQGIELLYQLGDRPPFFESLFAALQHLLAIFVSIVTPPAIIASAMGLSVGMTSYVISMSLFVSGVATFIQAKKFGPVGSGLLSIQGTSFTFLGAIIAIGTGLLDSGSSPAAALTTIFGVCFLGSFVQIILSRFLPLLRKVITPLVSGIIVTLIGFSLVQVGFRDIAGGAPAQGSDAFGSFENLLLAALVLVVIVIFNRSKKPMLRMSAILIGLAAGYIVAAFLGRVDFSQLSELSLFNIPVPFKYGFFQFEISAFINIALLFLITTVESIGDLTATSLVSGQPVKGDKYIKTVSGGVLGDGVNSTIAAVFNTFPNTTFSQNNGIIQMTGVASRYIGFFVAGLLAIFGIFPIIGGLFSIIPSPVLGGATIIMFGTVAASGIKLIAGSIINRRGILIMAISFGLGLGVMMVPDALQHFPDVLKSIFGSPITTGGVSAILLNVILPRTYSEQQVHENLQTDIT